MHSTPHYLLFQGSRLKLVSRYGIYISRKQLDEVIDKSMGGPTRMIQTLMGVFFTLAKLSCLGKEDGNPALDIDILSACLSK